ncbi:MAG: DUF2779 domain-containing protein [Chloroflexota bacterium]|nr:DUF2779 domain-containing protein [Chloroflexota bacterium]
MTLHRLSKSRFMAGNQCHLRLWYDVHERHLRTPVDAAQQAIFDTGHEVGDLARERYPGGHFVAQDYRNIPAALAETQRLIEADTAAALFEPAFQHDNVLARVDMLERLPDGGWRMVEVKSTTRRKDEHILDAAVQLWVLRGAGLNVRDAGVLTLDRSYIYDGIRLDIESLFKLHPVFEEASALLESVGWNMAEMQAMLTAESAPDIAPGAHCFKPYDCWYYQHCTKDIPQPEHGIKELSYMKPKRLEQLEAIGVSEIRDIPNDFPLNPLQSVIRETVIENTDLVHGNLAGMLTAIKPPMRHLDFETFQPAIPRFAGTRPYDQIPFLFSVHTEVDGASPEHVDYIHENSDDPRPLLVERLLEALGSEGSICVYSRFERTQLKALAEAFPQYANALEDIIERLVDLLPIVRSGYYHPGFRGSFSLKSVLPIIAPGMGYDDLEVADGRMASVWYARAVATADARERRQIFDNLRAYCARDTLAMVELRKALMALAHGCG